MVKPYILNVSILIYKGPRSLVFVEHIIQMMAATDMSHRGKKDFLLKYSTPGFLSCRLFPFHPYPLVGVEIARKPPDATHQLVSFSFCEGFNTKTTAFHL